nr:hypothetical protein CFP56_20593 [Quercus suber]
MELYIGLTCACALAFASFVDHYGPAAVRSVQSYTSLLFGSRSIRSQSTVNGSITYGTAQMTQVRANASYHEQRSVENENSSGDDTGYDSRMHGNLQSTPTMREAQESRSRHDQSTALSGLEKSSEKRTKYEFEVL